jgi:hypothetical protein
MLPHLIEALLIVAAVLGAAAGYVAGGALACNYHLEPSDPRWGPLEASYNASVLAASGGAWPKGQPALADTAPSVCRLAGRADVIGDYCQVDYTTQAKWPSGVQPTACQPIGAGLGGVRGGKGGTFGTVKSCCDVGVGRQRDSAVVIRVLTSAGD